MVDSTIVKIIGKSYDIKDKFIDMDRQTKRHTVKT